MTAIKNKLLVVIVEKHKCDALMAIAKKAGATGGTVILGRGTAESSLLRLLGLDDLEKELLYTVLPEDLVTPVMHALRASPTIQKTRGLMFSIDVLSVIRSAYTSTDSFQEYPMSDQKEQSGYELISLIVNKGYADQVMDTARAAGATGGTVINARGTARPEDAKFFGITLVPEKELIMILSARSESAKLMERIQADFAQAEPGSGIAFRMPVENFEMLGPGK